METYQIVFYAISAFLVLIATMQRSKNEETLKEYNILLLPLFTILGMLLIYAAIIYIPIDALNRILLVFFAVTGYYTTMINTFFLIEFTEYEIEENVLNNDMTDSEFSELSIKDKKRHKAKEDKRSIFTFFKSLYYSTKNAILRITLIDFLVYCFSASVVAAYVYTRNEILTEIISISICFTSIREIKIYSVVNGYTILTIYFIYDIIKLVYNDKMNNLTKDIDVPIKLVLPMTLHGYELVGFGDLLIPAFFIAICKKYGEDKEFRSMWYVSYISFCMGIVIGICLNWDRIDEIPMMLFVSPTVGITTLAYAAILGRTKDFLMYKRKSVKDK